MPSNESQVLPVNCFMSYRRPDNDVYRGVVDQLKSDLAGRFEAETGRGLKIFVDRDDIGWGEDWRQKILDSIKRATFFIPVITMRYFDSPMCKDEFTAFYEDAKRIGVTGLIRPVILAGGDRVVEDSPNEQMRIVARLNHVSIEQEFDEGYDSPLWHKKIKYMVNELSHGIEEVEAFLESRESISVEHASQARTSPETEEAFVDFQDLQSRIEIINGDMTDAIKNDLNTVVEVLEPVLDPTFWDQPQNQQRAVILAAASSLRKPAAKFAESATKLEKEVVAVDSGLRLALDELNTMESETAREAIYALTHRDVSSEGYEDFSAALAPINDGMRLLGMMNINMRKASQPVLQGIQSVKRVADVIESWQRLGGQPDAD